MSKVLTDDVLYHFITTAKEYIADHKDPALYGIKMDTSQESMPATYYGSGLTSSQGTGWDNWKNMPFFKDIKPCVVKNGVVQYYLSRDQFFYKEGNSGYGVLYGADGDVMIEIPFCGFKIERPDANNLSVSIVTEPNKKGYCYFAHSLDNEADCDKIYVGVYLSSGTGTKLNSYSAQTPRTGLTINQCRDYHENNGVGYQQMSFYPWVLLQVLYLIIFKNANSQATVGAGYTNKNNSKVIETGETNSIGMFGNVSGNVKTDTEQIKCLGIEDMWGNAFYFIDGAFINASGQLVTAYKNFNNAATGYSNPVDLGATSIRGAMLMNGAIVGQNYSGFLAPSNILAGSSSTNGTTYWCDNQTVGPSRILLGGWKYDTTFNGGIFSDTSAAVTATNEAYASRMVYKHKK